MSQQSSTAANQDRAISLVAVGDIRPEREDPPLDVPIL